MKKFQSISHTMKKDVVEDVVEDTMSKMETRRWWCKIKAFNGDTPGTEELWMSIWDYVVDDMI